MNYIKRLFNAKLDNGTVPTPDALAILEDAIAEIDDKQETIDALKREAFKPMFNKGSEK